MRIAGVAEVTRAPSPAAAPVSRWRSIGVTNGGLTGPRCIGHVVLAGELEGIGKSPCALQLAAEAVRQGRRALYVSAEEAPAQVRARASRLDALGGELWLLGERRVEAILGEVDHLRPELVVVDSIQTVGVEGVSGVPGSVTQVREAALLLAEAARTREAAVLLVGHVTKDGSLAGPRQLEHLVDTVLSFEGDRHHALRLLRAVKHRFGPTSELGLFEMVGGGLVDVDDASGLLLADRRAGADGSVVFPMLDGRRPLLVEIQSLVVTGPGTTPRRSAEGLDSGRLGVLLAVLGRMCGSCPSAQRRGRAASLLGGVAVNDQGCGPRRSPAPSSRRWRLAPSRRTPWCAGRSGSVARSAPVKQLLSAVWRRWLTGRASPCRARGGPRPPRLRRKSPRGAGQGPLDRSNEALLATGLARCIRLAPCPARRSRPEVEAAPSAASAEPDPTGRRRSSVHSPRSGRHSPALQCSPLCAFNSSLSGQALRGTAASLTGYCQSGKGR